MALSDIEKLPGSFGYRLCALYLPQRDKSVAMSEALRMLVAGLGEEWRNKATFDDVCMELELAGVGYAGTLRSAVLAKLGESIEEEYAGARKAAGWIAEQDRKLGVWVACACAREALKYVARGEDRPRIAVETAEAWVRGEATKEQVEKAANAAASAARAGYWGGASTSARAAAASAANAANAATNAAADWSADFAAAAAVGYAARALWNTTRDAELRHLVSVIARSLQTFPVLLTAPE